MEADCIEATYNLGLVNKKLNNMDTALRGGYTYIDTHIHVHTYTEETARVETLRDTVQPIHMFSKNRISVSAS